MTRTMVGLAFVVAMFATRPGSAQDFRDFLAAGEFGPAARLAAEAPAGARDDMLAQLAKAQANAGASRASLTTAAGIGDDRARAGMLDFLGSAPVGGAAGGAAMADFDSLIELVTTTIAPDSWEEVGGPGAVAPFPGGVYVDASGVLKKINVDDGDRTLAATRHEAAHSHGNRDVRQASNLRKVSLSC